MTCLQTLRNTRWLPRLVLLWFALFIGAAVASPMIKPVTGEMVCSMGGMKLVAAAQGDTDGQASTPLASMDCPLCAPLLAPPAPETRAFAPASALAHALQPLAAAHIAGLTGAPLPPRGPPALN
jgi:hypothetical protein